MPTKISKPKSLKANRRFHVSADHKWATRSGEPPFRQGFKDDWRNSGGQRTLNRQEKLIMTERREEATNMHE